VTRGRETRAAYSNLVEKLLQRTRRWEDKIKTGHREISYQDGRWTELT
jgi:hypothetical protein